MALGLPAAVAVDQLRQIGRLLGVPRDELVLDELLGCWSLCSHSRQVDSLVRTSSDHLPRRLQSHRVQSWRTYSGFTLTGFCDQIYIFAFQLTQAECNENECM